MKLSRSLLGAVALVALAGSAAAQQFDFPPVQYGGPFGSVGGGSAPSGPAGGDLSGSYPNPTVAKATMPSGGILSWNADTGLSRDSVLGAGNVDLGNGSANDKSGTLNLGGMVVNGTNIKLQNDSAQLRMGLGDDVRLSRVGPASLQFGSTDAAAPVAQTLGVQNVVAGTTNTAGVVTTILNSAGTGTALGGNTVFKYAPHDVTHTVNTFTGAASPYTIGFTAGNITTYPIGTVMTVSGCTTATLNGTYTVTASSSGSVTATTSATGTGSPTTCQIVGNTSQNAWAPALTINGDTAAATFVGSVTAANVGPANGGQLRFWGTGTAMQNPSDGVMTFINNAGTSFGRLQLGGTTSSFPSIKLNGTAINFRLADDSADAPITASAITNSGSLIAGGSAPTPTGTCTRGTQNGGNTTGSIVLTCTAQTLILTFVTTAPTGYMCEAIDQTTTADTMKQTSNTTTSCTLTGTTAASDVVIYQARAY